MKSREYNLASEEEKARKQMMELILLSSRFVSSITVENKEKHFNGKSILKAGELKKGEHFYVVADGADAEAAIEAFDHLFPLATSQTDTLARPFGGCREGQNPRC